MFGAASNQYFYRIASTFAHSATSTQIKFIISANQGGQQYGVAQCILLASLCHASCLTCSAETSTACLTC